MARKSTVCSFLTEDRYVPTTNSLRVGESQNRENIAMNLLIFTARAAGTSLILLVLAACGESPQSPRQTATSKPSSSNESPGTPDGVKAIDPCTLLADEEIKQTTGYPVLNKKTVTGS